MVTADPGDPSLLGKVELTWVKRPSEIKAISLWTSKLLFPAKEISMDVTGIFRPKLAIRIRLESHCLPFMGEVCEVGVETQFKNTCIIPD